MTLHTIIEQCLPKEKDTEKFSIPHGVGIGEYRHCETLRREGYNQYYSDVKSTIPTIVELLIAEIEKMDRWDVEGCDVLPCEDGRYLNREDIINLLKQK